SRSEVEPTTRCPQTTIIGHCKNMYIALFSLAQIELGGYFSYIKLGAISAFVVGWAFACQWADTDAEFVKTKREQWNLIVLSGGVAGLFALLFLPWPGNLVFLGLAFFVLLSGGGLLAYVLHRNGRVVLNARVLTVSHIKRTLARTKNDKMEKQDKGIRVMLATEDGKSVKRPQDPNEIAGFDELQELLFDALWRRATQVDLAIGAEKARVIYRIDGVPLEKPEGLSVESADRVITYLKKLTGLNPEERRRPQTGCLRAALLADAGNLAKVEVITSGSTAGERLRLMTHSPAELKRIGELGLVESRVENFRKLIKAPAGLVIFSGPKQSGITTTQYAVMREHDAFMQNLHTMEKTPLLELDNITQHRYRNDPDINYARQLQTVLRREPDVMLIGECEDRETAELACKAAMDDKKIYLAIEAGSTIDALARFMAFVENPPLAAKGLLAVINQRLIRVLCETCRESYKPDEKLLRKANLPADRIDMFYRKPPEPILDKRGREIICQTCRGSGYAGRTAVFELLMVDKEIKMLVAKGAPMKAIKAQARKNRMYYLQEEGLLKVIDGTTSLNEVLRGLRADSQ
ncbi:MAG: Flp pilus assembly complex ATPase component TadA, partial [Phycisphaerae bacterium]|nr:Flp pilus assembly complex ATPase component TadA [Phycisphaerae bacterium]